MPSQSTTNHRPSASTRLAISKESAMDAVMQSPVRWKIPLPNIAGIEGLDFDRPEGLIEVESPR
jgi:hypothetical protein